MCGSGNHCRYSVLWVLVLYNIQTSLLVLELLNELRDSLEQVSYETSVRNLEDGCIRVLHGTER